MEKVLKIVKKENAGFDARYWAEQSSESRINALEHLRTQQLTINGTRDE